MIYSPHLFLSPNDKNSPQNKTLVVTSVGMFFGFEVLKLKLQVHMAQTWIDSSLDGKWD